MIESPINTSCGPNISVRQYLFNPFRTLAGAKALFLGLVILFLTTFIGSLGSTHFDGVLDVHTGQNVPLWFFFAESLIDWLCMVLFLVFSALLISPTRWRFIDILGTQALARWPTIFSALVMLPDANRRFGQFLMDRLSQSSTSVTISSMDAVIFGIAAITTLVVIIWMVVLMYKAYAVSCNVKGAKAIVPFIVSIILAEILSKVIIVSLFKWAV